MQVDPLIHGVFGHFQNLNLLALIHDLRGGRSVRGAWVTGKGLCPISHGMPVGQRVLELRYLGETEELGRACDYAARHMGADPFALIEFVRRWDTRRCSTDWLLRQLEELWRERLADAIAVQEVLRAHPCVEANENACADHANEARWRRH